MNFETADSRIQLRWSSLRAIDRISVALETNRNAYIGFLLELPGAFVRGRTEKEALAKVNSEVTSYLRWLKIAPKSSAYDFVVTQRHQCSLMVEDADNEILLESDRDSIDKKKFTELVKLVRYSGETFLMLYDQCKLKDWIDQTRIRKTFYGESPKIIREIFEHVNGTQYYYLSRTKISFDREGEDFVRRREFCLRKIEELYHKNRNSRVYEVDNELWTLKKILRRFVWHDRIHGKSIVRILQTQKRLNLIEGFSDPFFFF